MTTLHNIARNRRTVLVCALALQVSAFAASEWVRPSTKVRNNRAQPVHAAAVASDVPVNAAVAPLDSAEYGATYKELAAKIWQWQFAMPVNAGAAACSAGQSGNVWFLTSQAQPFETSPGVMTSTGNVRCNVPEGKALFIPLINAECSTMPGDQLPPFGPALSELRPCSQFALALIDRSKLKATVDGVEIKGLEQYEITSDRFTFGPLPENNQFQSFGQTAPAGTTAQAVSSGFHLLIKPLSKGAHTIHVHGEADVSLIGGPRVIMDATYQLTVGN